MPAHRLRLTLGASACALAIFSYGAGDARAYCRTVTQPIPAGWNPQVRGCFTGDEGVAKPLYWKNACVGYNLQKNASTQVSLEVAAEVIGRSFDAWSAAACGEAGPPSVSAVNTGTVDCGAVEYNKTLPNQHVIVFRDDEWPYNDPNNTLGLTTVTYDTRTGEIYDADMELNSKEHTLSTEEIPAVGSFDLATIVTHEAGHFLGLSHSAESSATMYGNYHFVTTRLTADDVTGICEVYPPDGTRSTGDGPKAADACDPTPRHGFSSLCGEESAKVANSLQASGGGGCSVARTGTRPWLGAAWLGAASLAIARWRRARRGDGGRIAIGAAPARLTLSATLVVAALACLVPGPARASAAIPIALDDLARAASTVAVATPVEQQSVWEAGRIYTYTRVHVDRAVSGPARDDLWIRTMGGVVGDIGQAVDGEASFTIGRPSLVFLTAAIDRATKAPTSNFEVAARAQGQFPLTFDPSQAPRVTRSSRVGLLVAPHAPSGAAAPRPALEVLHDRPLEDAIRDVVAAWRRTHGD